MQYPTLPRKTTQDLAAALLRGENLMADEHIKRSGTGRDVDLDPLVEVATGLESAIKTHKGADRDAVEGASAVALYLATEQLDTRVVDDPDFWAYLSLGPFWAFVYWREAKTFDGGDSDSYLKYVDGRNVAECVLTRTYLRGKLAVSAGTPSLASDVPSATDLWRSHVIRVRTSYSPALTSAVVRTQRDDRLSTNDLRALARNLNRSRTNLVTEMFDIERANALVTRVRDLESAE